MRGISSDDDDEEDVESKQALLSSGKFMANRLQESSVNALIIIRREEVGFMSKLVLVSFFAKTSRTVCESECQ